MKSLPLEGVTVLDFSWQIAGPLGTKALLELGARVIRVESSAKLCNLRIGGPHPAGHQDMNHGAVLHSVNSCKESLAIDLSKVEGRAAIQRLIPHVQAVMNNFTPGMMARWGLSFSEVARLNPTIVYVELPAMGSFGPHKDWRAYGVQISAIAGVNAVTGYESDPLNGPGPMYPDFAGNPFHAATAIVAALETARRTNQAVYVDIGQYESTAALLGAEVLAETALGTATLRLGNRHRWQAPHGVFPTLGRDHWIAIAVGTDQHWDGLRTVLDLPAVPEWETLVGRRREEDRLEAEIATRTRVWDGYALMAALQSLRVPAGVVQSLADMLANDPYLAECFYRRHQKGDTVYRISGPAFHFAGVESPVGLLADIGADTEKVLEALGGYGVADVASLEAAGVLR